MADTDEWVDANAPAQAQDEWIDAPSPQQGQGADEWVDAPQSGADEPSSGGVGAFARQGLRAAPSGFIGGAGALTGAAVGAGIGSAFPIVGTGVGAFAGMLAGGLSWGWLGSVATDELLAAMGLDESGPFSKRQQAADMATTGGKLGHVTGGAAAGFGLGAAPMAARAVGAGIQGAIEGGRQAWEGEFDPTTLLASTAAGAVFTRPYAATEKAAQLLTPKRYRAGNTQGGPLKDAPKNEGGENTSPDLNEVPTPEGQEPDIVWTKGEDAKAPDIPTAPEMEQANQSPQIGVGIAMPQHPASKVEDVGNFPGAAGSKREAGGPELYPKNDDLPPGEQARGVLDTPTPVTPEIEAVLKPAEVPARTSGSPQEAQQPGTADVPAPVRQQGPEVQNPRPEPARQSSTRIEINGQRQTAQEQAIDQRVMNAQRETLPAVQPERPVGRPEDAKQAMELRQQLTTAGHTKIVEAIDLYKLSPREAVEVLQVAKRRLLRERPVTSGGAKAGSEKDLARKEAETDIYHKGYEIAGPQAKAWEGIDPADIKQRGQTKAAARQVWKEFMDLVGGDPWGHGTTVKLYEPVMRDEQTNQSIQVLKAVRRFSMNKMGWKEFAAIIKHPSLAAEDRATGRIDADINRGRTVPEVIGEKRTADEPGSAAREYLDEVPPFKDKEGNTLPEQDWVHQSNDLRTWLNELSNRDYDTLNDVYKGNLLAEVRDTNNPHEVLADLLKTLGEHRSIPEVTGPREGGVLSGEMEGPPKRVRPKVEEATEANWGQNAEKNFKQINAEGLEKTRQRTAELRAARLAGGKAEPREGATIAERAIKDRAVDSTDPESLWQTAERFITDEGAAGKLHEPLTQAARKLWDRVSARSPEAKWPNPPPPPKETGPVDQQPRWQLWHRFRNPANPSSPNASQGTQDYVRTLAGDIQNMFRKLSGDTLHTKLDLQANLHAAIADAKELDLNTPYWHRRIAIAEQNNRSGGLPQHARDWQERAIVPLRTRAHELAKWLAENNTQWAEALKDVGKVTTKSYWPRFRIGEQSFDDTPGGAHAPVFDPWTGRNLSGVNQHIIDRTWKVAENGGERVVIEKIMDKDNVFTGDVRIWRLNQPTRKITVPAGHEVNIGDTLNLTVKGKKGDWAVDHASTAEIEAATHGQVRFHENSLWAWTRYVDDMQNAVEQIKVYQTIRASKAFNDLLTTSKSEAEKRGYSPVPTRLEAFAKTDGSMPKEVYMPDRLRWAFDDYNRAGFGVTSEGIEAMRNFNIAMLKVFNTNAPFVHVLNEANLFVVGRGWKNISPMHNYRMAQDIPMVMKSVNTQDALQREMRNAGVNPLLATTKVSGMYKKAAEAMGMEITRNWRAWDAPFKPWGRTAKEVGEMLYHGSSDLTWRGSDYLTTLYYLEQKRAGWSPEEAGQRTNKFLSDYHVDSTVLFDNRFGRSLQQFLTDSLTTSFGRYKAGVWRTMTHMTKDLVKGDPMLRQRARTAGFGDAMVELKARQEAMGQLAVVGVMAAIVGPYLDKALQGILGDDKAEFRSRGVSAPVNALYKFNEKGVGGVEAHAWTPSPGLNIASEVVKNQKFGGKEIVPTMELPRGIPQMAGHAAEYAAESVVPPYKTISRGYARKEGGFGTGAKELLLEQVGANTRSDAAEKRLNTLDKVRNREEKARSKGGVGPIADGIRRMQERFTR